jgi:hypothetical protein
MKLTATRVSLNGKVPPALVTLPKGVRWKKERTPEDVDFVPWIWQMKKQSDPAEPGPAALAQFAVRYLASPQAASELPRMQGGEPTGQIDAEEQPSEEAE